MAATGTWTKVYDEEDYLGGERGEQALIKKIYTFKCSSSYATGGDTVTPATDIGLDSGSSIVSCDINEETGLLTYVPKYDITNNKVLLYNINAGTQISSATDVSTPVFRAVFLVKTV